MHLMIVNELMWNVDKVSLKKLKYTILLLHNSLSSICGNTDHLLLLFIYYLTQVSIVMKWCIINHGMFPHQRKAQSCSSPVDGGQ